MSLIIPTASSTYGDATTTEGGRLRKYVLAQFRDKANLDWVRELRSLLLRDELKYVNVKEVSHKLKKDRELWSRVELGVAQASIIVIDPEPYDNAIRIDIQSEGSGNLPPINEQYVNDRCATEIIRSTPIAHLPDELEKAIPFRNNRCTTAIVGSTPIAHFPLDLAEAVPWGFFKKVASLEDFSPPSIREKIGGGLKHAMIFAARSHAIFDLEQIDNTAGTTRDVLRTPLVRVLLSELLSTCRIFDNENPSSMNVLNEAADVIADSVGEQLPTIGSITSEPLVREMDSRGIDEIQAADIAAGWARDLIEVGDIRSLAHKFERVWVNGIKMK